MNTRAASSGVKQTVLVVRALTSRVPRIRGVGLVLAWVANYFKKYSDCEVEVSTCGWKMLLNTGDAIGNVMIFTPQWHDPHERQLIRAIIGQGDYVVDVGANVGVYTLLFASLVGARGAVLAVEAEPANARRLTHNVQLNSIDWVTVRNVGVSDKKETLPMLINTDGNAGAHSFYATAADADAVFCTIACVPLFGLLEKRRPQLVKLDIEGFEWRVLRRFFEDAPKTLWPNYILLEDDLKHREHDAVAMLTDIGYRVMRRIDNNAFLIRAELGRVAFSQTAEYT